MKYRKNEKNRKITAGILCLLMLILATGCSLAVEDGKGIQSKDQLIGGMITREYVEKTYAQIEWEEEKIKSLHFDGIEGYYVIYSLWEDENGQPVFSASASEGLDCEPHYKTVNKDQTIELNINGYVLFDDKKEDIYYLNPIYMTKDRQIYTVAGNSASTSFEGQESVGWSINEAEKIEGISNIREVEVKVSVLFTGAKEPVKIQIIQMNEKYEMIQTEEFLPEQVPDVIQTEKDAEYVVFVTEQKTGTGETVFDREACSWDGETTYGDENAPGSEEKNGSLHYTTYSEGTGFLLKKPCWVIWPE